MGKMGKINRGIGQAVLGIAAMVATMTVAERGASAATIKYYYAYSGFEDCTDCWSPWESGIYSGITIGPDPGSFVQPFTNQKPGNDAILGFVPGGSSSDFALIDH